MRANKLLIAALTAAGLAATGAVQADARVQAGTDFGTPSPRAVHRPAPRFVHAPVPALAPVPAPHPVSAGFPGHDGHPGPGQWAWDGRRPVWMVAPNPYVVPVFGRDGRFLSWDDRSGDVPRHNVEALRANYRSQRD